MKPLCIDLFCGLGGWSEGFLAEGWDVIGFDIERHRYGDRRYPAQLVLADVLGLWGSQFRHVDCIVASHSSFLRGTLFVMTTRTKAHDSFCASQGETYNSSTNLCNVPASGGVQYSPTSAASIASDISQLLAGGVKIAQIATGTLFVMTTRTKAHDLAKELIETIKQLRSDNPAATDDERLRLRQDTDALYQAESIPGYLGPVFPSSSLVPEGIVSAGTGR